MPDPGMANLAVALDVADALPLDNRCFTVIGAPRRAQVLLVTPGNRYLVDSLRTPATDQIADITFVNPEEAKAEPVSRDVQSGRYDLVIYDQVRPDEPPQANTLYFGALPPGKAYEKAREIEAPVILDWDVAHPLLQFIRDLPTVAILKALTLEPPLGSTVLIESNLGPLAFVTAREGYADTVVTFGLLDAKKNFNTNWYNKYSFPLFLFNALQVLGNGRASSGDELHLPEQPVQLRAEGLTDKIQVAEPDGKSESITRSTQGTFIFNGAHTTGLYQARWGQNQTQSFAVNLFDPRESDLAPRGLVPDGVPESMADTYKIKIGFNPIASASRSIPARHDWWKPIALIALGVVLLEWYIYNRRVYI
jgi:hypothetical protein